MNTNSTQEAEYRRCPVHTDKGAMTLAESQAHELLAHRGRSITCRCEAPTAYVGVWLNERATPVGNRAGDDYFEGTAEELAAHFDGEVQVKTGMGVRLAIPCGPDCLKQAGCWTYRSYFPAS